MKFHILGPLQIHTEQGRPDVFEPRQLRALAPLLLAANRTVSRRELTDAIWDEDPPVTAGRQLQNLVSALRRRLTGPATGDTSGRATGSATGTATGGHPDLATGPAEERALGPTDRPAIVADASGYQLRIGRDELDAEVFTARVQTADTLAAGGRCVEAAIELRRALALWRGPALHGLTGAVIEAGAARLDEHRLAVLERCVDLELQLGRHEILVGELTELALTHPLRERLVGQLMLALHRCGRRADALNAYQRLRVRLSAELGLGPGADLRELHTAILRDQACPPTGSMPTILLAANAVPVTVPEERTPPEEGTSPEQRTPPEQRAPGTVPRQLPAAPRQFVGRTAELAVLDAMLGQSGEAGDSVPITAIGGTAGVGKTTLALHWAHRVAGYFPDGQLYVNLRGFGPSDSAVAPAEVIRWFCQALGVPGTELPADIEAQAGLYRSRIAGRRLLVVLDNARDIEQVRPLLPGSGTCVVVVTSRSALSGLVAAEGAQPITLRPLSPQEATQLLAARLGEQRLAQRPAAARALTARCARLPLALSIVAARAATQPSLPLDRFAAELAEGSPLDALDAGDPTTQVRAVFGWSYARLSPPAATLFRLLGLHPGPDVSVPAAASLLGTPIRQARTSVVELVRAHLLDEHRPGRYANHDLLSAYAAELAEQWDSADERRAGSRRLLDHYLHSAHTAARMINPQRDAITLPPRASGAVESEHADASAALAWLASEYEVLLGAIDRAAADGFDVHAWQLAWTLTDFLDRRGLWHDWLNCQRTALAAAERLADRRAQASVHRALGGACARLGRLPEATCHLDRAIELFTEIGDDVGRAHTHAGLTWVLEQQQRFHDALVHAQRALALFRASGRLDGQAIALNAVGWYHAHLGDYRQALAHCRLALALQEELDDTYGVAATWDSIGFAHHRLGEFGLAVEAYQRAVGLFRGLGDRYNEADTLVHLGDTGYAAGDPDAARRAWQCALGIFTDLDHPDAEQVRAKLFEAARH